MHNSVKCCYEDKISIFWGRFLPQMAKSKFTAGEYFNTPHLQVLTSFFHRKLKEEISLISHKYEWVEVSFSVGQVKGWVLGGLYQPTNLAQFGNPAPQAIFLSCVN